MPMMGTSEVLAGTPIFEADAFSQVLDIVHVRGETAKVVTPDEPLAYAVPAGPPCVYIVERGTLEITVTGAPPVTLYDQ